MVFTDNPATTNPVARELAPAGLRSSPNQVDLNQPDPPRCMILGPLRSPAGASSLATRASAGECPDSNGPNTEENCGSEPARDSGVSVDLLLTEPPLSRADSLPQRPVFGQSILPASPHPPLRPPLGQNAQKIEQIGIFHCPPQPPNLDPNKPHHPDQGTQQK